MLTKFLCGFHGVRNIEDIMGSVCVCGVCVCGGGGGGGGVRVGEEGLLYILLK